MPSRQRVVLTISVPPDIAAECRDLAKAKGESLSLFFREMLAFYRKEKLKDEFYNLQKYGSKKAKALKISEKNIEQMIFEGR